MEEVFDQNSASLPSESAEGAESTAASLPQAGKRILRGTYHQGLLLLREEVLKPLSIAPEPNRQPSRILYSSNKPGEPIRSFEPELLGEGVPSPIETSSEMLELIKRHAEQAQVANELIKHLTEQLEEQNKYIERLRAAKPRVGIWTRLKKWFGGRR